MIKVVRRLKSSSLLKIFSLTGISTVIKLLSSYLTIKILATLVGPSGVALIGQLQNFTTALATLGSGGINNGVVKYVAEHKDSDLQIKQVVGNGFKITALLSLFIGFIICVFSVSLSEIILLDEKYYYLFIYFGIGLFFLSVNNFFVSVLNGYKEFRKFVTINIVTSILGFLFTFILVITFNVEGALIACVTYQAVIVFFTVFYIRRLNWFKKSFLWVKWNKKIVTQYGSYSLMALISAVSVPVTQLLIRRYLIDHYSITAAGYWESMNKISGLYLMVFTTTFSVYYLPKLSEIRIDSFLKKEIVKTYKIFTPVLIISLTAIFLLKDYIIAVLFTKDFMPVSDLFVWQLLGDLFKTLSWILAFVMVAKSMSKIYILSEIVFSVILFSLTCFFVHYNGLIGSVQAYFVTYFIYFFTMIIVFRKLLFSKPV